jgi:hypothetical protein
MTERVIRAIHERTQDFTLHIYCNEARLSDSERYGALQAEGLLTSVTLDSRNTRCLYPKKVFHAMVPADCPYYVVTDNDFLPAVNWLPRLLAIMDANPKLAMLAPFYWPYWPMNPYEDRGTYYAAEAVGNTFRVIRRAALDLIIHEVKQDLNAYGDDGLFSKLVRSLGWEVGIAKDVFTYNLEQVEENRGYLPEESAKDPRTAGYGKHQRYEPLDWETLAPPVHLRIA